MVIDKVINNNIVSAFDEKGREIVIMGRGLGFKMRTGQPIEQEKVEKIFKMDSPSESEKLKVLFADLPLEHIQVSNEIIHYAKKAINKQLNKSIYITLTDHINFAIDRFKQGMNFHNALLWEIKQFYNDEYEVGMKAIHIIKEKIGIELPDDEAGSIALHFVNAEFNTEMCNTIDITKMIQSILNIIQYHYHIAIDEESLNYQRFITHLKFFSQRVLLKQTVENVDVQLYDMIRQQYHDQYLCADKIKKFINKEYNTIVTDDEMIYLTIHIKRITTP